MDGQKLELKLTASEFSRLRTPHRFGNNSDRILRNLRPARAGPHKLTLENRHLTAFSVYLINAAQPRIPTIQITRQKRNENQSAGKIEFTFHPFRPKIGESGGQRPSYR